MRFLNLELSRIDPLSLSMPVALFGFVVLKASLI